MPRIEVRSTGTGETHYCTSSNPSLIADWLGEMMSLLEPSDVAPMQIRCWPLRYSTPAGAVWDWPAEGGYPIRLASGNGSDALRQVAKQLLTTADILDAPPEDEDEPVGQLLE